MMVAMKASRVSGIWKILSKIAFVTIIGGGLAAFVAQGTAHASLVLENTHNYDFGAVTDAVAIKVDVYDQGSNFLWQYTVTNNGYAVGNGFSGFELGLPVGVWGLEISAISRPRVLDGLLIAARANRSNGISPIQQAPGSWWAKLVFLASPRFRVKLRLVPVGSIPG